MRRLVVGVLLVVTLCGCARVGGEPMQATRNGVVDLSGAPTVGQSFQSPTGTVAGVDLLVATYGSSPDAQGELAVALVDVESGATLAEAGVAGSDIDDNSWVPVRFDEPVQAEGVPAAFLAAWDGDGQVGLHANIPPADYTDELLLNDPYPGGELITDGEAAPGDLAFRVVGDPGPGTVVATAAGLVRGAGAALLRQPVFGVAWMVLFLGAVGLAGYGWRTSRARNHT